VDANFGFLAKQLLLTELHGSAVDIPGGIEVLTAGSLWLGLWDGHLVGDVEKYVVSASKRAGEQGSTLRGAVLLSQHGQSEAWSDLADALFVYGLPETTGPEGVLVLDHPPHPKPRGLRFLPLSESPGAWRMESGFERTTEELTGPAWPDAQQSCELLDVEVAWHDTTPIGAVGTFSVGLTERIALLWIEPAWREKDLAQALVEHVSQRAQEAGRLLVCAWAKRGGLLRFALSEGGFAEQLTARFFSS
jgi:hypothetical protein